MPSNRVSPSKPDARHLVTQRAQASVREGVAAMAEPNVTPAHEAGRLRALEREVVGLRIALIEAHAQLESLLSGEPAARWRQARDGPAAMLSRASFEAFMDSRFASAPALQGPPTAALFYLNLDGFKAINDRHGSAVGDELLRLVGLRMERLVRASDRVTRLQGDEFVCLVGGLPDRVQLIHLACKLFDAIGARMMVGPLLLDTNASIGVAVYPADGDCGATLLASAHSAMRRSKRQKSGYAFFDDHTGVLHSDEARVVTLM